MENLLGKHFEDIQPVHMELDVQRQTVLTFPPVEVITQGQCRILRLEGGAKRAYFPDRISTIDSSMPDEIRVHCPLWWAMYCGLSYYIVN